MVEELRSGPVASMYPGSFRIDVLGRQEVFPMYSSEAIGHHIAGAGYNGLTSAARQGF